MAVQSSDQPKNNDSTPENRAWEEFLPACLVWCTSVGADDHELIWDDFEWAPVEAAIHELCHAVVIGEMPPAPELMKFVTSTVNVLDHQTQLEQEKRTSTIEYFVCQRLGIPLTDGDIVVAAQVQGVDEQEMWVFLEAFNPQDSQIGQVIDELHRWKTKNEQG